MDRVDALLACPVGCVFVLMVAKDEAPLEEILKPPLVFAYAASAVDLLSPWSEDHFEIARLAMTRAAAHRSIAELITGHSAFLELSRPLDRDAQMYVGSSEMLRAVEAPSERSAGWELYAQKPTGFDFTSTVRAGTSSREVAIEMGAGDLGAIEVIAREARTIDASARVYEVSSGHDWHALCRCYPAVHGDGNRVGPYDLGTLVPDWFGVARDWDGVHLSLAGLLTATLARVTSDAGTSMHWAWDAESTLWLRDVFTARTPLPDGKARNDLDVPNLWFDFPNSGAVLLRAKRRPLWRWRRG